MCFHKYIGDSGFSCPKMITFNTNPFVLAIILAFQVEYLLIYTSYFTIMV